MGWAICELSGPALCATARLSQRYPYMPLIFLFRREEKSIHHHRGDPPFFLFPGLRLYGVYPSFRTYGVYPFPLFSQANGIHHSLFCFVTSGSGDRPRKEGCHGGGVYSFFPCFEMRTLGAIPLLRACALEVRYSLHSHMKRMQHACDTPCAIASGKSLARYGGVS